MLRSVLQVATLIIRDAACQEKLRTTGLKLNAILMMLISPHPIKGNCRSLPVHLGLRAWQETYRVYCFFLVFILSGGRCSFSFAEVKRCGVPKIFWHLGSDQTSWATKCGYTTWARQKYVSCFVELNAYGVHTHTYAILLSSACANRSRKEYNMLRKRGNSAKQIISFT